MKIQSLFWREYLFSEESDKYCWSPACRFKKEFLEEGG